MGYVAVKGGNEAIEESCRLFAYERTKGASPPLLVDQIREQLYLAVDRVMSEGGLYAPELAALALKQTAGDTFEASFVLRAFRATQQRLGYSLPTGTENMRIIRRISSAFKDIPGGQILGATSDYTLRIIDFDLLSDDEARRSAFRERIFRHLPLDVEIPQTFPKVISILRREGLLADIPAPSPQEEAIADITRQPLTFPAPRSASLQALARGETGGMLALAYSSMRGYGNIHPTLGELRVGYLPLTTRHPVSGEPYVIGEVKVTEAEVLARMEGEDGMPMFSLGYGLCFGQNEIKAISMAILDRCTRTKTPKSPAEDQEFVLYHTDGIEAMGFCNHWKLPHYVDFLSDLDRLRKTEDLARAKGKEDTNAAA
ncbi:MAG: carbon-phosphorus lyase complex subunit PhnI [Desulforhopalus sp.]|nr:carbon-phosphorus lyase complex subunit PhnI [Desulforhopalus sp.]